MMSLAWQPWQKQGQTHPDISKCTHPDTAHSLLHLLLIKKWGTNPGNLLAVNGRMRNEALKVPTVYFQPSHLGFCRTYLEAPPFYTVCSASNTHIFTLTLVCRAINPLLAIIWRYPAHVMSQTLLSEVFFFCSQIKNIHEFPWLALQTNWSNSSNARHKSVWKAFLHHYSHIQSCSEHV